MPSLGRFLSRPVLVSFAVLVCLIVILVCGGAVYQWAALRHDRQLNPMPGRLVDVGGYRMHIYCTGSGSPTVVLESGLGDTWLAWYKVQPLIAQFSRVCSYDRAGMGWSDASPKSRTGEVMATELHQLLQNAGVASPYVLLGHSLGGMIARTFSSRYRGDVSALVLVDAAVPHEFELLPRGVLTYSNQFLRAQTWKEDTVFFGLPRLMGWCGNGPAPIRSELRTVDCRAGPWKEHMAEWAKFDESSDQVLEAAPLENLPVAIISEDSGSGSRWNALQASLLQASTDSCRIIAKGSGHNIPSERPSLIADVVHKLVEQSHAATETRLATTTDLLRQFNCVR